MHGVHDVIFHYNSVWDDKEDPIMNDKILEGVGRPMIPTLKIRDWIHEFVVNNVNLGLMERVSYFMLDVLGMYIKFHAQ